MKVLHVAETLKGGLETYLRIVASHQAASPDISQVKFVLPGQVDWLGAENTHVVPTARKASALLGYARSVRRIIAAERPAILHLHSSIAGGVVRAMALAGQIPRGVKIVYCSHGWAFDQTGPAYKNMAYRWIERLLSWRSDAIICISKHEIRIAEEFGIRRCQCIPNGIDRIEQPVLLQSEPAGAAEPRKVLFVGRLDKQKGIDALLDAYARVRPNFKLIVVGDSVRKDLQLAQPAHVEFKGWLEKDALDAVYRACDATIVPSRWEGFGLVAVEAMARGKPVFASAVGGLVDIVEHGTSGRLFSLDQMDQALRDIDGLSDAALRQMGEAGRRIFEEKFTSQRMNTAIVNLYKESVLR
ncbi:glycosyltransferase involved in cell wall biosynthesis [Variovorax boronicumulans]|uniref:glycosyltransferase family 4 protein n=1 Tax=Variovorax boronicumulans TaxID=436515 RepID=UPI00159D3474|nr:glycosyltransferase family 4 protein [Variovorax boronicumulans]MDQ0015895.1 glycosyltransferase involved in cell wall biosynthesis [Variovorax boronicumulans]